MMSDVLLPEIQEKIRRYAWYVLTHSYAQRLQLTHEEIASDMTFYLVERENKNDGWLTAHTAGYVCYNAVWHVSAKYRQTHHNYLERVTTIFDEYTHEDELPEEFNETVIAQLSPRARTFVENLITWDTQVLADRQVSRRKYCDRTGESHQSYLQGRLLARQEIAALLPDDHHAQRAAAHDLEVATRNRAYQAVIAPNNTPRSRGANGQYVSKATIDIPAAPRTRDEKGRFTCAAA